MPESGEITVGIKKFSKPGEGEEKRINTRRKSNLGRVRWRVFVISKNRCRVVGRRTEDWIPSSKGGKGDVKIGRLRGGRGEDR